jgi:hypothetical protein
MKVYPTTGDRRRVDAKGSKNGPFATLAARRSNPPPVIYVATSPEPYHVRELSRAHIRNKRGYVYLAWRDGDRVRNFYLGKAPRKSPTDIDRQDSDQVPAPASRSSSRRGKK